VSEMFVFSVGSCQYYKCLMLAVWLLIHMQVISWVLEVNRILNRHLSIYTGVLNMADTILNVSSSGNYHDMRLHLEVITVVDVHT